MIDHYTPKEEIRRIIISDMVKKRNSIVPLVLLWLSYELLNWIRNAFLDEPSGQAEGEEGSKVMWRYTLLKKINKV